MKPDDYLTPETRKMISKQQEMLKPIKKHIETIESFSKPFDSINSIANSPNIPGNPLQELVNSQIDINKIIKPSILDSVGFKSTNLGSTQLINNLNIPKLPNNFYENTSSFQKSINIIAKQNSILANTINTSIKISVINNPNFSDQLITNVSNILSTMGLNESKTVLTEYADIINQIVKNKRTYKYNSQDDTDDLVQVKTYKENENEYKNFKNEINNQSTPFTTEQIKRFFNYWINEYKSIPFPYKFISDFIITDNIGSFLKEYFLTSNINTVYILFIALVIGYFSGKMKNK